MDHQLQQLTRLGLEFDGSRSTSYDGPFHDPPVQGSRYRAQARHVAAREPPGGKGTGAMADRLDPSGAIDPTPARPGPSPRQYRIVAIEGVASNLANQLTAAAVVLPFIAVALGGPLLAATLIYPVFTLANLTGAVMTPRILSSGRSSKTMLAVAVAGLAVLTGANAVGSALLGEQMATGFVATAAALGFLAGVSTVCFLDVVAGALQPGQQSRLPVLQSSLGAALVLLVTFLDRWIFGSEGGASDHIRLLWLGALALLVAAGTCLLLEAAPGRSRRRRASGAASARDSRWPAGRPGCAATCSCRRSS